MDIAALAAQVKDIDRRVREVRTALVATGLHHWPANTRVAREANAAISALQRVDPHLVFLRAALEDATERDYLVERLAALDARH